MANEEIQQEIKIEIENLERLNNEMNQLLEKIGYKPNFIEVRAAGSILHDFYSGVEKIFERIALALDNHFPKGENWHMELLLQMSKPFKEKRESIISEKLLQNLKENLRFRHLFRHVYGFELTWERFEGLCRRLKDTFGEIKIHLYRFLLK